MRHHQKVTHLEAELDSLSVRRSGLVVRIKPEEVSPRVHEVAIRSQDGVKVNLQGLADEGPD